VISTATAVLAWQKQSFFLQTISGTQTGEPDTVLRCGDPGYKITGSGTLNSAAILRVTIGTSIPINQTVRYAVTLHTLKTAVKTV
jgi:hypothetical protein